MKVNYRCGLHLRTPTGIESERILSCYLKEAKATRKTGGRGRPAHLHPLTSNYAEHLHAISRSTNTNQKNKSRVAVVALCNLMMRNALQQAQQKWNPLLNHRGIDGGPKRVKSRPNTIVLNQSVAIMTRFLMDNCNDQ